MGDRPSGPDRAASGRPGPVIVKLGGSVITRKREVERLRPKLLHRLAEELASTRPTPIVLVHGAGGFGHRDAARWGLNRAPEAGSSPRERLRHAAIVQAEVRRLHGSVLATLLEAGADPVSVPLGASAVQEGQRLAGLDPAPFSRALAAGAMPVTFGDVVRDAIWGFSILSGDTIALELARSLSAARVVFVSDVPGILEDRRRPGSVRPQVSAEVVEGLRSAGGRTDATGGIRLKAERMREIARHGVDAALISGLAGGRLASAIRGEAVYGSWARAASPG